MRAIDRSLNDLAYLNEQLRGGLQTADAATLARAADLMEALYECDGEVPEAAGEAARKMLAVMGLTALDYTEENRRLFNALPSKSETRTLSPAIVSLEDRAASQARHGRRAHGRREPGKVISMRYIGFDMGDGESAVARL